MGTVSSVKSRWWWYLRRITGICAYLSLTQRRRGRKGFYVVNWLHGFHRKSSWSPWSVETRKHSAWELFHHVDYISTYLAYLRESFAIGRYGRTACVLSQAYFQLGYLDRLKDASRASVPVKWNCRMESVSSVKSRWFLYLQRITRICWIKYPRDPRDPWRQINTPHGNCWIREISWPKKQSTDTIEISS